MDLGLAIGIAGLVVSILALLIATTPGGRTVAASMTASTRRLARRATRPLHHRRWKRETEAGLGSRMEVTPDEAVSALGVAVRLLGHYPDEPYRADDIEVRYTPRRWGLPDEQDPSYFLNAQPEALAERSEGLPLETIELGLPALRSAAERVGGKTNAFFNGPVVRLESASTVAEVRVRPRRRLVLHLRPTNYYTFWLTHRSAELIDRARSSGDLALPVRWLANNLPVTAYLVTSDGQLLYTRRSMTVAQNPGRLGPSVSGDMHPKADTLDGVPHPVRALIREASEELGSRLADAIRPADMLVYGLVVNEEYEQAALVGEISVDLTAQQIVRLKGDDRALEIGPDTNILTLRLEQAELPTIARRLVEERDRWEPVSLATLVLCLEQHLGQEAVTEAIRDALATRLPTSTRRSARVTAR